MNTKKMKKLALATAVICASSSLALFSNVLGAAETNVPVYADGNEVFKTELYLGAWCEPSGTDAAFERYKEIGFNAMYLMNSVQYNTNTLIHYLELGEKHDIKMIIANGANRSSPTSLRYQTKFSLADYPAFYGIHACDEPQGDGTKRDETAPNYKPEVEATEKTGWKEYNTIYDYMYAEYEYLEETYPGKYYSNVLNFSPIKGGFGYLNTSSANLHLYVNGIGTEKDSDETVEEKSKKRLTGLTYKGDGANWYTPTETEMFATLSVPQASLKSNSLGASTLLTDDDYLTTLTFAQPSWKMASLAMNYRAEIQIASIEVVVSQFKEEYLEFNSFAAEGIVEQGLNVQMVDLENDILRRIVGIILNTSTVKTWKTSIATVWKS